MPTHRDRLNTLLNYEIEDTVDAVIREEVKKQVTSIVLDVERLVSDARDAAINGIVDVGMANYQDRVDDARDNAESAFDKLESYLRGL